MGLIIYLVSSHLPGANEPTLDPEMIKPYNCSGTFKTTHQAFIISTINHSHAFPHKLP